jgi:uncharacterized damage-inducible protein DinB
MTAEAAVAGAHTIGPGYARTMAAYNAEMNRRVYAAAGRLSEAERRADRGAFWESIHGTLAHLLWADRVWLARFGVGEAPQVTIGESAGYGGGFAELGAARVEEDARILGWAAGLAEADLAGDLTWWSGAVGRELRKPRALLVMQIFNHQTHHRGQVHAMLTAAGERVGDTDLPFVLPD